MDLHLIFFRIRKRSFLEEASQNRTVVPHLYHKRVLIFPHQHFRIVQSREHKMLDQNRLHAGSSADLSRKKRLHLINMLLGNQMPRVQIDPEPCMILIKRHAGDLHVRKQIVQLPLYPNGREYLIKRFCHSTLHAFQ